MTTRYRKISQVDVKDEESKKLRAERVERIVSKIHAIFWVLAAIFIIWGTDIYNVILYSNEIHRWTLNLAIVCLFANIGIIIYLTFWIPVILKIQVPWDIYCPNMIPLSTVLGISVGVLTMISFWPLWGMLSPLYVVVIFMGMIFSTHFIPWPC